MTVIKEGERKREEKVIKQKDRERVKLTSTAIGKLTYRDTLSYSLANDFL
jgi:hypothetical protein